MLKVLYLFGDQREVEITSQFESYEKWVSKGKPAFDMEKKENWEERENYGWYSTFEKMTQFDEIKNADGSPSMEMHETTDEKVICVHRDWP